jgi:hypothetical protein
VGGVGHGAHPTSRQQLDRDAPVQARVFGEVDHPHPALAQDAIELVTADHLTHGEVCCTEHAEQGVGNLARQLLTGI